MKPNLTNTRNMRHNMNCPRKCSDSNRRGGRRDRQVPESAWAISRLHMSKNRDWHTETEVRLAMIDLKLPEREFDAPLYIPMRDALKAVILGSEYPAPRLVAEGTRKLLGARAPEFFRCIWHGGVPKLTVLMP